MKDGAVQRWFTILVICHDCHAGSEATNRGIGLGIKHRPHVPDHHSIKHRPIKHRPPQIKAIITQTRSKRHAGEL